MSDPAPQPSGTPRRSRAAIDSELPAEVARLSVIDVADVLVSPEVLERVRGTADEDLHRVREALSDAIPTNTARAYRADWTAWSAWCALEDRPALPARPLDLALYLVKAADTLTTGPDATIRPAFTISTLRRRIAAISAVHQAHGYHPSPTHDPLVRLTLRGLARRRARAPRGPARSTGKKKPLLLEHLVAMLEQRPAPGWPGGVARRRDRLLLLAGFAGALRRSEAAAHSLDDVLVDRDLRTDTPLLLVDLGPDKTDQTGERRHRVALPRGNRPLTCPLCAYRDWAALLETHADGGDDATRAYLAHLDSGQTRLPSETRHRCDGLTGTALADGTGRPLYRAVNKHGHLSNRPLSGWAVNELVKRYADRIGLDPARYGSHSLRAGFATEAAGHGATDRQIMRQGRWAQVSTVHGYIALANPLDDNAVTKLGL